MTFQILETFSKGKSAANSYTEDRIVIANGHFGVLDGSKGPGYAQEDVITTTLDRAVAFIQDMPADISLIELIDALNAIAAEEKNRANITDFRAAGGFVFCLYSAHFNEIWRVGDCKFRINGTTNEKFWSTEETCAKARAMILQSWRSNGLSDTEIMDHPDYDTVINHLLAHEANFLNRPNNAYSFGAIIGLPTPAEYIESFHVKSGSLVITSDGYPTLADSLEQTESALSELLERDPLCIRQNLQCKGLGPNRVSFDDRAFVRAELSG